MDKAITECDIEAVKKLVNEATTNDDSEGKDGVAALFEKVSRSTAMKMVKANASVNDIEKLFLFVVDVAKADLCTKDTTVSVIQDILECSKKTKCAEIFTIVENHIGIWKAPEFDKCKNRILRMCNDLLKRLSRTIDTQFCGRINILLARSLPLNERSGLNQNGEFNFTNETDYDLELDNTELQHTQKDEDIDIDSVPEIPVDFKLYQRFWQLQNYFCNPNKLYQNNEFETFQTNLNEVLTIFATYRLDKRRTANNYNQQENAMEGIEEAIKRPDVFFAKYQTSQKLLHLQFADPQFRRYFLVQCLILVNYLQSDVRFRDQSFLLSDDESKFIVDLNDKCYKLLRDTFPRGHYFAEFVKKLLSREKIWSTWKNESCPDWLSGRPERVVKSFRRIPLPTYNPQKIDLGNEVLNRLWSLSSDNLSACKDPKRNFVPKLEVIIDDALDHADPDQGVEDKESCFNNEIWQWKQSRLFLTKGENFLTVQSTPAARKPCPDFSEVLKKGVYSIAMHSRDEAMRERGKVVSEKAEAHRIKREEDAKKAEEEQRQKAEEDAKQKAMEAAAERKKKEEELAAKRAREMADIAARKPKKEVEPKEPENEKEKEEDTKPIKSEPKEKENGSEPSPSRKERRKTVDSRPPSPSEPRKDRRIKVENGNGNSSPQETRKERKKPVENGNSSPSKTRKRATPIESDDSTAKRSRRNGNDARKAPSPAPSSRRAAPGNRRSREHDRERSSRRRSPERY